MISVDNITVSYGGWDLFSEVSLLINPRDRIGLVGKNGAGKTTLLKIITGEQIPTQGVVSQSEGETIGYLPQQMKVADTTSLVEETAKAFGEVLALEAEIADINEQLTTRTDYESESYENLLHRLNDATDRYHILGGETRDADIERTLLGLGFRREDFGRPTKEFSGGWRMRIELAKLLLARPSVFLLDEPTNHLDIESIQWLEGYLRDYPGAVVVISHDRAFLDNVTNRTVEISLGKLYDYKVPYSKYVVLRHERREQQMAAYANQQRMIEKTEEFIEKFRYKPTKSNQVQSRVKQLEKLERLEVDEEDTATLNIKFPPAPRSGQVVAEVKNVGKTFPPRKSTPYSGEVAGSLDSHRESLSVENTASAYSGRATTPGKAATSLDSRRESLSVENTDSAAPGRATTPGKAATSLDSHRESLSVENTDSASSGRATTPGKAATSPSSGEIRVFSGAEFTIERGEKIALVGRNGEGKTTFARMLIGELEPTEGTIRVGANVNTGYYAQNQDDLMDGNFTVYDTLDRVAVGDIRTRLRDILAAFLFRGGDIDKKVKVLSGGERSRLAMARLMLEPYNLLVLDEPTNHMDMRSKDILKRALMRYDGTVVVVSHDREFLDGLVDKVYEFRDGGVREYLGDIWYFLEKRKLESLQEVEKKSPAKPASTSLRGRSRFSRSERRAENAEHRSAATMESEARSNPRSASKDSHRESLSVENPTTPVSGRATTPGKAATSPSSAAKPSGREDYERRKEAEKAIRKVENAITATEKRVEELEKEVAAWDNKLADPAAHGIDPSDGKVFATYNDLKNKLSHEMHEWEKLNYELEILTDDGN